MRYLIIILLLFIGCSDNPVSPIHGCLDSQACNYNPSASIDNNSCEYQQNSFFQCNSEMNYLLTSIEYQGECEGIGFLSNIDSYNLMTGGETFLEFDLDGNVILNEPNYCVWAEDSSISQPDNEQECIEAWSNLGEDEPEIYWIGGLENRSWVINGNIVTITDSYGDSYDWMLENNWNLTFTDNITGSCNQIITFSLVDSQDSDANDSEESDANESEESDTNPFEAIIYDDGITQNAIIKLNQPIGCCYSIPASSNMFDCLGEEEQNSYSCYYDYGSVIKIVSEDFFGTDCQLYYDSENYLLSGYEVTTAFAPNGTGQSCNPGFLNIFSENGLHQLNLSLPETIENIPLEINAAPNPFEFNCCESEDTNSNYIIFTNLPENCTIDIYDTNYNLVKTIDHNSEFSAHEYWDLENNQNQLVDSGIYIYEITSNEEKIFRNTLIVVMTNHE